MNGRYALTHSPADLRAWFGYAEPHDFPPRHDIAPDEPVAVVTAQAFTRGAERHLLLARWGLLPAFVREPLPLIPYARAETVLDRQSFAPAFRRRRCLAPASGFYLLAGRRRRYVRASEGAPLGLAALSETYLHPNGSEIDTVCLVTAPAVAPLADLAERAPAIIPRAAYSAWLDHETTPLAAAHALLTAPSNDALSLFVEPAETTPR